MEVFRIENTKYIVKCPECSEILKFIINLDNFTVSVFCKNNHNKYNIDYEAFKLNYIRNSQHYNLYCYQCNNLITNISKICKKCNKLLCYKCINEHTKIIGHNLNIDFIQQYKLCQIHEKKYSFYCEDCKINICEECKSSSHDNHYIKSFIDLIKIIENHELNKKEIKSFIQKLNHILLSLQIYKNEKYNGYQKLENFFNFIKDIYDKLIFYFNDNYFDYFNYENYNYLLNLTKDEIILDISKYKDYILHNGDNEKDKNNIKKIKHKNKNKKEIYKIKNFKALKYLKDNLFYIYDYDNLIKIYEFKNFSFSFNSILLSCNLNAYNIKNIIPGKFSDIILINFDSKKNIKILEYDILNKSIKLSKNEIKDKKSESSKRFDICIDNQNNNIITSDSTKLTIWKKNIKKFFLERYLDINEKARILFNVNSNLFGIQNLNNNIKFYSAENYQCVKILNYKEIANYIGVINNEIIGFNNVHLKILFFVNIKYLEIVQIINNNYWSYGKNNALYLFYYTEKKLNIIKKTLDRKRKDFICTKNIGPLKEIDNFINIFITDFGYLIICSDKIMLFVL